MKKTIFLCMLVANMKNAIKNKDVLSRIIELEKKVAELTKRIERLEQPVTMKDINRTMAIRELARRTAMGDKEAIKEWRRNISYPQKKNNRKRSDP